MFRREKKGLWACLSRGPSCADTVTFGEADDAAVS